MDNSRDGTLIAWHYSYIYENAKQSYPHSCRAFSYISILSMTAKWSPECQIPHLINGLLFYFNDIFRKVALIGLWVFLVKTLISAIEPDGWGTAQNRSIYNSNARADTPVSQDRFVLRGHDGSTRPSWRSKIAENVTRRV
jgi:hypothetical protein